MSRRVVRRGRQGAAAQVKELLDAIKTFEAALVVAAKSGSKFAPEAVAFAVRRLDKIVTAIETVKCALNPMGPELVTRGADAYPEIPAFLDRRAGGAHG